MWAREGKEKEVQGFGVEAIRLKMKADPNWEGLGMLGDAIEPWSHRQ